jgi:hypothetical protein
MCEGCWRVPTVTVQLGEVKMFVLSQLGYLLCPFQTLHVF